ncbi:uncharacterized protein LOC119646423 [Hermetia illucens]|nr:uncharacterized protein LOC119646423 [Hermetia illucens]
MSAPIRPHDENSKATLANKRKIRRRKISGRPTSSTFSQISENGVVESKTPESVDTSAEQSKAKGGKKSIARTRPTLGCDVVTLVSLISSEGSDSEKEESLIAIDSSRLKRPPLLRKSGKSVSFQEHDINNFSNTAKEFPHMIRRGSVAPLAARIRANRPPTAPPGSIFVHGFEARCSTL